MTPETIEGEAIEQVAPLVVQHTAPALFHDEDPEKVLEIASKRAKALMHVVDDQKLYAIIQGRKHLTVEAWQTLAILSGVTPFTEWCRETENGWEARVTVRNSSGMDIGAAEAQCTRDERTWAKRDSYALRSMAQTRATSKAIRSVLAFIAVLAGFEATPSDEMPGSEDSGASRTTETAVAKAEATKPVETASEPKGTPITIKARADLNALVSGQHLTPSEIQEVVGECLRDGRHHFDQLETVEEARMVYRALLDAKERVTTEIPL